MKSVFLTTKSYQACLSLVSEMLMSAFGLEMAAVLGRAGRGKTTAVQKIVTLNPQVVYVRHQERLSHVGLLREITFAIAKIRPRSNQVCQELIQEAVDAERRVIVVDEADRLTLKHLNLLRDLHDLCRTPVVMVGEEPLRANLERERRLISRVRKTINFEPVSQLDVIGYFAEALDQRLTPELAARLTRHAEGDWRSVVHSAITIERLMKASGAQKITDKLVREALGETGK